MGTDESPEDPGVGVEGVSAGFPAAGGQREGGVERCLSASPTHRPWLSIPGNSISLPLAFTSRAWKQLPGEERTLTRWLWD